MLLGWASSGLVASGCDRQSGGARSAERAAAFTKAVQGVREAAANAAQASECALTAVARLSITSPLGKETKQQLFLSADAAEGATGAADRAAAELQRLDAQCWERWDANCDYLMARIAIMGETAKDRRGLGCGRVNGAEASAASPADARPERAESATK